MGRENIAGKKYNRLTAIKDVGVHKSRSRLWEFQCDCGKTHIAPITNVKSGNTKSCGCLKAESTSKRHTTHGLTKGADTTKVYNAWLDIKRKCYDSQSREYCRYGAKGRGLQDIWIDDPSAFSAYVLSLPSFSSEMTLDRIDNEKGYEAGNLRWATPQQQARNRCKYRINTSGYNGVVWRSTPRGATFATAFWFVEGKAKSKTFAVNKFGLLPAFALACSYREKMITQLNTQGAGYSDKHGL